MERKLKIADDFTISSSRVVGTVMIQPYSRLNVPPEIDHAAFGDACASIYVGDSRETTGFSRTIRTYPPVCLPSGVYYTSNEIKDVSNRFLAACDVEFLDCCTSEFQATIFLPDHAVYFSDKAGKYLIKESLWHSELFFSDWFRNDATTNWNWRVKDDWVADLHINEPINFCYHRYYFQYFHWLIDSLCRVWLLKTRGAEHKLGKWMVGPVSSDMQVATLKLFDLTLDDCFWPNATIVDASRLIVPSFYFHEPIGTRPSYKDGVHHRGWLPEYLVELRDRAVRRYGQGSGPRELKLYITREDSHHRKIENSFEVDSLMDQLGFTRVTPGTIPFEQQVGIFSRARVIVGTHGAGMTNIIWASPGAQVLEFMPAPLGDPGYRFLSQLCNHNYSCLFVNVSEHPKGVAFSNITVDVALLRTAIMDMMS